MPGKVLLVLLGLGVVVVKAAADTTPAQAYALPPPSSEEYYAESSEAKYDFNWAVEDYYSGNNFGHQETRDGDHTKGSYYVHLPDGRRQTVNYYVYGDSGYVAHVSYDGDARYPESESRELYALPKPSYAAPESDESQEVPAYAPKIRRTFKAPTPTYVAPKPQPTPRPSYSPPKSAAAPKASVSHRTATYSPPEPRTYKTPKPTYLAPNQPPAPRPSYSPPKSSFPHSKPTNSPTDPVHSLSESSDTSRASFSSSPETIYSPASPSHSPPHPTYSRQRPTLVAGPGYSPPPRALYTDHQGQESQEVLRYALPPTSYHRKGNKKYEEKEEYGSDYISQYSSELEDSYEAPLYIPNYTRAPTNSYLP